MVLKDHDIELVGGVAIEATSIPGKRLEEASWLDVQLGKSKKPYGIVAGIDLTKEIRPYVGAMMCMPRFKGFR
jgi:hypothetical protein